MLDPYIQHSDCIQLYMCADEQHPLRSSGSPSRLILVTLPTVLWDIGSAPGLEFNLTVTLPLCASDLSLTCKVSFYTGARSKAVTERKEVE